MQENISVNRIVLAVLIRNNASVLSSSKVKKLKENMTGRGSYRLKVQFFICV